MPTPAERHALLFVAGLAVTGFLVRGCDRARSMTREPAGEAALARQVALVDSALRAPGTRRTRAGPRPVGAAPARTAAPAPVAPPPPAGRVDPDVADAAELDRLPGIGPALAARIVEDRASRGPFGSLAGLQRVRGIGPALAARLGPHVTFSQSLRPTDTERPGRAVIRP